MKTKHVISVDVFFWWNFSITMEKISPVILLKGYIWWWVQCSIKICAYLPREKGKGKEKALGYLLIASIWSIKYTLSLDTVYITERSLAGSNSSLSYYYVTNLSKFNGIRKQPFTIFQDDSIDLGQVWLSSAGHACESGFGGWDGLVLCNLRRPQSRWLHSASQGFSSSYR